MRYVLNLAMPLALTCSGFLMLAALAAVAGIQGVREVAKAAYPFVAGATLLAAAWGCYRYYRILRWDSGERDGDCRNCGGDTSQLDGKYGPYVKCRMCGSKREGF